MAFDGDSWRWIDQDAYQDYRPEHTGLDHFTRNQQLYYGGFGNLAMHARGLYVEGAAEPHLRTSVQPTAIAYAPAVIRPEDDTLEVVWSGEVTHTSVDLAGFITTPLGSRRTAYKQLGATGSHRPLQFQLDALPIRRYQVYGVVGVMMRSPVPGPTNPNLETLNITGSSIQASTSATPSNTGPHTAILDPNFRVSQSSDLLLYDSGGFDTSSVTTDEISFAYEIWGDFFRQKEVELGPVEGARTYNWGFATSNSDYHPYASSQIRPNIPPRYDRGGGQPYRIGQDIITRPRHKNIRSTRSNTKPTTNWKRHQFWPFVDADEATPKLTQNIWQMPTNAHAQVDPFELHWLGMVYGLDRKSWDNDESVATTGEAVQNADDLIIPVTLTLYDFKGNQLVSNSRNINMSFYPQITSGASPFHTQLFHQINNDKTGSSSDEGFPFKEGQLYVARPNTGPNLPDTSIMDVIDMAVDVTDENMSVPHRLEIEYDLSVAADKYRLYAIAESTYEYTLEP